jgi:hypothetical protein
MAAVPIGRLVVREETVLPAPVPIQKAGVEAKVVMEATTAPAARVAMVEKGSVTGRVAMAVREDVEAMRAVAVGVVAKVVIRVETEVPETAEAVATAVPEAVTAEMAVAAVLQTGTVHLVMAAAEELVAEGAELVEMADPAVTLDPAVMELVAMVGVAVPEAPRRVPHKILEALGAVAVRVAMERAPAQAEMAVTVAQGGRRMALAAAAPAVPAGRAARRAQAATTSPVVGGGTAVAEESPTVQVLAAAEALAARGVARETSKAQEAMAALVGVGIPEAIPVPAVRAIHPESARRERCGFGCG